MVGFHIYIKCRELIAFVDVGDKGEKRRSQVSLQILWPGPLVLTRKVGEKQVQRSETKGYV